MSKNDPGLRAEVTKEFQGTPDGDHAARYFPVGEIIYGALAAQAISAGNAKPAPAKRSAGKRKK